MRADQSASQRAVPARDSDEGPRPSQDDSGARPRCAQPSAACSKRGRGPGRAGPRPRPAAQSAELARRCGPDRHPGRPSLLLRSRTEMDALQGIKRMETLPHADSPQLGCARCMPSRSNSRTSGGSPAMSRNSASRIRRFTAARTTKAAGRNASADAMRAALRMVRKRPALGWRSAHRCRSRGDGERHSRPDPLPSPARLSPRASHPSPGRGGPDPRFCRSGPGRANGPMGPGIGPTGLVCTRSGPLGPQEWAGSL